MRLKLFPPTPTMNTNKKTSDVTQATLEEIHAAFTKHHKVIAAANAAVDNLSAELRRRYEVRLADALTEQGKHHGQHSYDSDSFKITGEVKATIKWNSDALRGIAQTLPHDQVARRFKIEFSVPEKHYATITDDKLLARLVEARTVKYSDPKFRFVE